ncbi:hypothetical protein DIPPA_30753 [Diplonema papillatum]|nr:hypothetical protein DIPPA_30753 [Diplonema papillatum]
MASARAGQDSLGAGFTLAFLRGLDRTIREDGTLADAYRAAERLYWEEHQLEADMNARAEDPALRFGEVVAAEAGGLGGVKARTLFCNELQASRL